MVNTLFEYENEDLNFPESDVYMEAKDSKGRSVHFPIGDNIQLGNTLVIGTSRTGKTVFTRKMAAKLRNAYPDAHFVFMDVKRDYMCSKGDDSLYREGDFVVSYYSLPGKYHMFQWSILEEALWANDPYMEIREITELLFEDMGDQGQNQIFVESAKLAFSMFCNTFLYRLSQKKKFTTADVAANGDIIKRYNDMSFQEKRAWIRTVPMQREACNEVLPETNDGHATKYAESVMSILRVFLNSIFNGNFAGYGKDSIHSFLMGDGKAMFLEFDYGKQRSSAAFFRLFLKKMIQQKMAIGSDSNRRLFLILDESMVVQGDFDLVNALNIGAGKGIRVILACQSIDHLFMQVSARFSEHQGRAAVAGFANLIAFRPNDSHTLNEIQEKLGKGIVERIVLSVDRYQASSTVSNVEYLVNSEELIRLGLGEAFVKIKGNNPGKLYFCEEG